ncbi:MAG: LysR family transcriptional regulator [Proteobacteria bacterium]|nr:LysR family transcriptional regulator [Pseudomonadota bacterium]
MSNSKKPFHIRSKIWIEDDKGLVIFGLGRLRILAAIDRCGSLNAAAKELNMSYRALWGKIKATEQGLGAPLLHRTTGGVSGGGSQLTDLAQTLIREFKNMHGHINHETDCVFDNVFPKTIA